MFNKFKYLILTFLLIASVFAWTVVFKQVPENILEVIFFDIGQGDSIFIETPNHKQILIDGGLDKSVLEKLSQVMPFYDRSIDLIILTHPDSDHITGLIDVIKYYQVGSILTSGLAKDSAVYQKWQEVIEEKDIPVVLAYAGQKITLQEGITLEIFWPEQALIKDYSKPSNNVSVVGKLIYQDAEILLTGDIEKKVEQYLVKQKWNLDSDVLKLGHHGSKTSSSWEFIKAVDPKVAVISVGEDNRYGHPNQEVLDRLRDVVILRTDQDGDISVLTDGNLFWLELEK